MTSEITTTYQLLLVSQTLGGLHMQEQGMFLTLDEARNASQELVPHPWAIIEHKVVDQSSEFRIICESEKV